MIVVAQRGEQDNEGLDREEVEEATNDLEEIVVELDTKPMERYVGSVNMQTVHTWMHDRDIDPKRYEVVKAMREQRAKFVEENNTPFYLHIFKGGFHLPLEPFFYAVLRAYNV